MPDQPEGIRDGQPRVEEQHLGARHHEFADRPGAGFEYLDDEAALLAVQHGVRGDQLAQLGLGGLLPTGGRVGAEEPGHGVGAAHKEPGEATPDRPVGPLRRPGIAGLLHAEIVEGVDSAS